MVIEEILGLVALLGMPVALASGSVVLAMVSAPRDRRTPVNRGRLLWGAVLATVGLSVMVRIAWATYEERSTFPRLRPEHSSCRCIPPRGRKPFARTSGRRFPRTSSSPRSS